MSLWSAARSLPGKHMSTRWRCLHKPHGARMYVALLLEKRVDDDDDEGGGWG